MSFLARSNFGTTEEWRVYNKIAWRLMPFLLLLYIISFLDRVNVGFAKLEMSSDIGLGDAAYGLGAGIFFIGYCLCEIPSNLLLQRLGAKFWIARIMVVWGVVSTTMMFIETPAQFYIARFLLGVAEAGFYPGIILYLTYWYPARLRSQICAIFFLGIALSGLIGGPLSGAIMSTFGGWHGLRGWQWLFFMEGVPAIVFGIISYFYLDDSPRQAKWLSPGEKTLVVEELDGEHAKKLAAGMGHKFGHAIKSANVWLLALANFSLLSGVYGVSFWLPQIVKDLGVHDLAANGLVTAIPFAAACVGMILIGKHSDRTGERRWHTALCGLVGAAGLIFSGLSAQHPIASLIGLSAAMTGSLAGLAVMWALPGTILAGAAAAAGIALMATIGNMGGYLAPVTIGWVKQSTGHVEFGLYAMAAAMIVGAILMLLLPKPGAARSAQRRPAIAPLAAAQPEAQS